MSRIGKKQVSVPSGVAVKVDGSQVSVKGPLGDLSLSLPKGIEARVDGKQVVLSRLEETRECRSSHGLARSLVANFVEGVSKGFRKELEIEGVGFKASVQGQKISLALGFSALKEYTAPAGIKLEEKGGTKITITGADKQQVGEAAARIRSFAPAEPYKGKGLRYAGEHIRRKVGKTVA